MRTVDRVQYLEGRIESLKDGIAEAPTDARSNSREAREYERQRQQARQIVRDLRHERTNALREAWRLWHERRVYLHGQIHTYESLARARRADLERLYESKPPPLPLPSHGGSYGGADGASADRNSGPAHCVSGQATK